MAHKPSGHFQPRSFWGHTLWVYRLPIQKQRKIHARCSEALETIPCSCSPHKQSMKKLTHNHCSSFSHKELSNIWLGAKMTVISLKGQVPKWSLIWQAPEMADIIRNEAPLVAWESIKWSSLGTQLDSSNLTSVIRKFHVWTIRTT